jgi:hypothetical protein
MLSPKLYSLLSNPAVRRLLILMATLPTTQPLEATLSTLLRLPLELRIIIYELALIKTSIRFPVTLADMIEPLRDPDGTLYTPSQASCDLPAVPLLQRCRIMHSEAIPIIFLAVSVSENSYYASRHLRRKFRSASFVARFPDCAAFPRYVRLELSKDLAGNSDCCIGQCAGSEYFRRCYM